MHLQLAVFIPGDALDDGDTAQRASDFAAAVAALIQPDITAAVNAAKINVLQTVFPVGSIYTSYNISTNLYRTFSLF